MEDKSYILDLPVILTDEHRGRRNVGLNWLITIPPRQKNFFTKIFSPGPDKIEKKAKILITNFSLPNLLMVKGSLISLVRGEEEIPQTKMPYELTLTSLTTTFQLYLNEQNIEDYAEAHDQEAVTVPVSFNLEMQDENNELIDKIAVTLNLELTRIENEPEIELLVESEMQYSSESSEEYLGDLIVRSTGSLVYAAKVSVKGQIEVIYDGQPAPDLLIIKYKDREVSRINVDGLALGNEAKYVLFLQMGKLQNPITDRSHLKLNFRGTYCIGSSIDNKNLAEMNEDVYILQDPQGTEINVTYEGKKVNNGDEVQLPEYGFFAKGNLKQEVPIKIGNIAKDISRRNAGLKIFNLGIAASVGPAIKLYDSDGRLMDITNSDVFTLLCPNPDIKTAEGIYIPNGANEYGEQNSVDIQLLFSALDISNVKGANDFHFTAEIRLTFEYYENKFGDLDLTKLERKEFSVTFIQPLYLRPNAQWLCVDYGTSAIVCLYDNEIINLKKRKESIINRAITVPSLQKDDFEKNSNFLSSDIIFHVSENNNEISSLATEQLSVKEEQYNNLAVFLSPTSSMYVNETLRLLPCLKLLVGNRWLPRNKYIAPYEYNRNSENGVIRVVAEEDRKHETSLLKVDQVFRQSYEALFRYYISTEVPDRNSVNRLVLTYPNTYTPRHIASLREIVKSAFPSLRVLEFVSESDAVASYYLNHWYDYSKKNAEITDKENILVYDMGAGTLDISYINKSSDENNPNDITMEILGKLGISKAGNYLDFVLAQIVAQLTDQVSTLATTKAANDENESKERTELKLFVKTQVKPLLKEKKRDKELSYKKVKFSIDKILDHPLFKEFLEACTDKILTQLVKYMNSNNGKLRIDTVLMSGRSCLLEPLQEKLQKAIHQIAESEPRFVILDKPIRNMAKNTERQKTAVAEGAMVMADNYRRPESSIHVVSKRHYASFGISYIMTGGKKIYHEILNHSDIPVANNLNRYTTPEIVLNNLNNVTKLVLIQSYLSAQDTEDALNNDNYEFVTEMEEVDTQALGCPKSLEVKLCIDSNNDIIMYFGTQRTQGQQPMGEDLQSEETKRSIWPVTI